MTEQRLSRRQFLKFVAAGMAAASIGALDLTPKEARALARRRQAGTLRIAWGGVPSTLNPLTASADTEIAFLNAEYDYLLDTDAEANLVPRLAESWEANEEGTRYTVKIVEGAAFHDGSALMLDDVLWTYEQLRDPESGSVADLFSSVESIEKDEEAHTVTFNLSGPAPDFLYNLTDNRAVILKEGAEDLGNTFNGSGPFILDEYVAEDRAIFKANPDYWGGAPGVETLEFVYFGDTEAAINALRGAVVDVVLRMSNATYLGVSDAEFKKMEVPTNGHDLVRIRSDREPGSIPEVRQAFKLATDRASIFDRVQLGFGAQGQDTPIGPLYAQYYKDFDLPERDPEAARQLLADAGYPDGLDMTLHVPSDGDRAAFAQALASQWEEAGIRVEIQIEEESVYYADDGWLSVDLGITPWGSRPVPQLYLDLAYKTGAVWNESHFSDEELDELIAAASTTMNAEERVELYEEIQRIFIERGPIIVPYFFAQFGVTGQYVQGVSVHPFAGRTDFHEVTVE